VKLHLKYSEQQSRVFFEQPDSVRFIIVPKGRRFGATKGAIQAAIEWALEGDPVLWGDTINSNIDRYFERYGKSLLIRAGINFSFNSQQKKLTFVNSQGFIDFRSADRPENWEGFGYKKIILNAAGIILRNDYLYTNAVLPMMMDFADSKLFALGVPKGKIKKDGKEHKFYTLARYCEEQRPGYVLLKFSSYDNPFLNPEDIKVLETEIGNMNPQMVKQEIYGEFIDEVLDALWTPEMIKHVTKLPRLTRIALGVDPTATKRGDAVGIVCAGLGEDGNIYVISRRSGNYSPDQWGTIVANEVKTSDVDIIVVETNQGGDMVEHVIRQYDNRTRIRRIHAVKSKEVRAEPVVAKYESGKVYHYGDLSALENEMLTWIPGSGKSPNDIDALVYSIMEFIDTQIQQSDYIM
jgi:predicted phage terminase large subunit-like protein